jgi:hypothetical protein
MSSAESDSDSESVPPLPVGLDALPHGWRMDKFHDVSGGSNTLSVMAAFAAGYDEGQRPVRFTVDDYHVAVDMSFVRTRYPVYHNAVVLLQRRAGSLYEASSQARAELQQLKTRIGVSIIQRLPPIFTEENTAIALSGYEDGCARVVSTLMGQYDFIHVPLPP